MFQIKKKAPKPVLHSNPQPAGNPAPAENNAPPQPIVSPNSSVPQNEVKSTNNMFGMMDVPDSERHKTMSPEEYNKKLDRRELVFGCVPAIPSIPAIDDITFDYCDGLRVFFPQTKPDEPVRSYRIFIKDEELGTVVCNEVNTTKEQKFYTTIQKYFAHFGLTLIRMTMVPQEMVTQLTVHYRLTAIEVEMIYELCTIPEIKQKEIENEIFYKCFVRREEDKPRYAHAIQELLAYAKTQTFHHSFNPEDKEVFVQFPISTIGDSIGWFSYLDRFQKKTKCKLLAVMNPNIYDLYEKQYPNIKFIEAKDTRDYKPYASYNMGLFFKADTTHQPFDFRYIGNGRTVSKILDVDDTDIAPLVDLSAPRKIKEPYVCIATNGSAYCKMWTHPTGWQEVIDHLLKIGYKVICIDKDRTVGSGVVINHMPWGVIDDTGPKSLQDRINTLKDCDFFIGVSSGVSWLAWCAKCPVVMISGFTNPYNEYYTPYRVINPMVCHGCWNDETCDFDHYDYMWCPRHKGTPRAYECSKCITPEHVLNVIARIPAYQKMKAKYDAEHKEPEMSPYLKTIIPMPVEITEEKKEEPSKSDFIAVPGQNFNEPNQINIQ